MQNVLISHSAELDDPTLAAVRTLCDTVFDGDFSDADWDHALGGVHALLFDGGQLIAHAALVTRRILHGDRALRTGYVEAVAVAADRRREGHGAAVMTALHPYLDRAYELGALGSSAAGAPLYLALGWTRWTGSTAVLAPDGVRPTPDDDGAVFVRPVTVRLDPGVPLVCEWRNGDVW